MIKNTTEHYGSFIKLLHWLMAFLIVGMLCFGYLMEGPTLKDLHKLTGLTILTLVALRLIWRLFNKAPELPKEMVWWEKTLAHVAHGLLYACMFVMPLSGWAAVTAHGYPPYIGHLFLPMPGIALNHALGSFFGTIHKTVAIGFIALICLHLLAAVRHHFVNKNNVLKSMMPERKRGAL